MSTKKPISDQGEIARQDLSCMAPDGASLRSEQRAVLSMHAVVAAVSSDLRTSSTKSVELMQRSAASKSRTTEIVAWARDAIARSRVLLDGRRYPSYRVGAYRGARTDEITKDAADVERVPRPGAR